MSAVWLSALFVIGWWNDIKAFVSDLKALGVGDSLAKFADGIRNMTFWDVLSLDALIFLGVFALVVFAYYVFIVEPKRYARRVEDRFCSRRLKKKERDEP